METNSPTLAVPTLNPGTVSLGIGEEDFEKDVFKLLFTCRKEGFDFLGQLRLDARLNRVDVEMFNEGYFGYFEDDKETVMVNLAAKSLSGLGRHSIVPEKFRELGKGHLLDLKKTTRILTRREPELENEEPGLQEIFDQLNEEYFGGKVDASIEWGREMKTPNRRSFRFGSYDSAKKLIRIHPRLNQTFVPRCVLELTIFHEMCHQVHPPVKRNSQWQAHHRDFKKKEREYRHFREATQWEKLHWAKLLSPAPAPQPVVDKEMKL